MFAVVFVFMFVFGGEDSRPNLLTHPLKTSSTTHQALPAHAKHLTRILASFRKLLCGSSLPNPDPSAGPISDAGP